MVEAMPTINQSQCPTWFYPLDELFTVFVLCPTWCYEDVLHGVMRIYTINGVMRMSYMVYDVDVLQVMNVLHGVMRMSYMVL